MGERRGAYIYIYVHTQTHTHTHTCIIIIIIIIIIHYIYSKMFQSQSNYHQQTAVTIYMNITDSNYTCRYIHHRVAKYTELHYLMDPIHKHIYN